MEDLLRCQNLEVSYDNQKILHNINFTLRKGEVLGIVGESGSGKSTLIKSILDLLSSNGQVTNGQIIFKDLDLLTCSKSQKRQISGRDIGMVFQDSESSLCPIRKIGSQIHESLLAHRTISIQESKEIALDYFNKVGFEDGERIWNSYPFELSGGMNQRVGICLAMLHKPAILLADEPTSALDVSIQKQVIEEILLMRDLFSTAIILVTHDIGVVNHMADQVLVLKEGRVIEYGAKEKVLNHPQEPYTKALLDAVPRLRRR